MRLELSKRIDVVENTPWANCASVSLASVLPKPMDGNEDLMGLAFHNDGTIDYLKRLLHVGLYRQGYCPLAYESDDDPDIRKVLRESYKDTQANPFIDVFGAIVLSRKIYADRGYLDAMDAYLAEQAYLVNSFDPEDYGANGGSTELHVFSVVSVHSRAGKKKAGIIDTAQTGWGNKKLPRLTPLHRIDEQVMKQNPFFEAYPIVSRGIRFEYLDHAHTGVPKSFWEAMLNDVDIMSESAREAGKHYL